MSPELKKELKELFDKSFEQRAAELMHHFTYDGWPINAGYLFEDTVTEVLGIDFANNYGLYAMAKKLRLDIVIKNGKLLLQNGEYVPVSYDSKHNRLITGVMRDDEENGWIFLGPL